MKDVSPDTKLRDIIANSTDEVAIINAIRLMAELDGLLPKPIILYDGDIKDEKEAEESKVSLLERIIDWYKNKISNHGDV